MFGIGSTELLVILVVALVVLGPKSLPGIAKTLGKVMGEFRRVSTEFQRTMNAEVAQDEHEKLKKEAEEELFGTNSADASTAKAKPSDNKDAEDATQASEQKAEAVIKSDATTPNETVAQEEVANNNAEDACATQEVDINSPLAKAVAKAEAEANTNEESKDSNNRG